MCVWGDTDVYPERVRKDMESERKMREKVI